MERENKDATAKAGTTRRLASPCLASPSPRLSLVLIFPLPSRRTTKNIGSISAPLSGPVCVPNAGSFPETAAGNRAYKK